MIRLIPSRDMTALSQPDNTADVLAIMKVLATVTHAQDDRDAAKYRSMLTDEIYADLPMIPGFTPRMFSADEWVKNAIAGYAPFYSTDHQLFNYVIDVDGDEATCDVDMSAVQQEFEKDGEVNTWTIGGRYYNKLRRIDGQWKICARTLEYRWHTGRPVGAAKDWTWAEGQRRIEAHKASGASDAGLNYGRSPNS
jgi:SnoaL-like protein